LSTCQRLSRAGGSAGIPLSPKILNGPPFRRHPLRVQGAKLLLLTTISYYRRCAYKLISCYLRRPHPYAAILTVQSARWQRASISPRSDRVPGSSE